ncbi:MAG TPA: HD domain-containing protein [Rhodospirillaceae bacterium]|nr:HD domain-containing protein [Rhodospirillaceae bacterium]
MLLLIFIGAVLLTLILAQGAILRVRSRTMKTVSNRESELIVRLSRAAEFRDPETGFHISRMGYFSKLIAMQLGLSEKMCGLIQRAACMHDVGKIGTPDSILLKAGPLDTKELAVMRRHPEIGHSILDGSESALIKLAAEIAITHHEKFDGTGYPSGLSGEEIPLVGRIVAVADVFDALTSTRPYKVAWDIERARSYLLENQGSHFDPRCVEAFMSAWPQVKAVREQYPDQESRSA